MSRKENKAFAVQKTINGSLTLLTCCGGIYGSKFFLSKAREIQIT